MMQEDTALCAQQLASKEHGEAEAKRSYGQAFAEALTTGCLDDATRALVACGFSAGKKVSTCAVLYHGSFKKSKNVSPRRAANLFLANRNY
jgi:hypothetical protein